MSQTRLVEHLWGCSSCAGHALIQGFGLFYRHISGVGFQGTLVARDLSSTTNRISGRQNSARYRLVVA